MGWSDHLDRELHASIKDLVDEELLASALLTAGLRCQERCSRQGMSWRWRLHERWTLQGSPAGIEELFAQLAMTATPSEGHTD